MTTPQPDSALALAFLAVMAGEAISHLIFRPELQAGRLLNTLASYALGMGIYVFGLVALVWYRGVSASTPMVEASEFAMQVVFDAVILVFAAGAAPVVLRWILGDPAHKVAPQQVAPQSAPQPQPRSEDVQAAILQIRQAAEELTRGNV